MYSLRALVNLNLCCKLEKYTCLRDSSLTLSPVSVCKFEANSIGATTSCPQPATSIPQSLISLSKRSFLSRSSFSKSSRRLSFLSLLFSSIATAAKPAAVKVAKADKMSLTIGSIVAASTNAKKEKEILKSKIIFPFVWCAGSSQ